jgi:hypothetical protein
MCETTDGIPPSPLPMKEEEEEEEEEETSKYDDIVTELNATKEELLAEKKLSNDLKHRLQLKAVSIDCQMIETENLLDTSKAQNEDLSEQIELLKKENESTLQQLASLMEEKEFVFRENASLKEKNESLLQRTSTLARRDQIQKASIMTYEDDIVKLMTTTDDFQNRFQSLASGLQGQNEHVKNNEQTWKAEKDILNGCIQNLKSDNNGMKIKFIQTLTKHQSAWQSERDLLQNQITELESEKKKDNEKEESFKKEITELLTTIDTTSSSSVRTSNTIESTDTSTSSTTNDETTDTSSTTDDETTVTSGATNDESPSQITQEQLRNDLNNVLSKFDKINAHKGQLTAVVTSSTTNDESPSQITQEQLRNDLNNVERKFDKINARKGRLLFLPESLIPSSVEEREDLNIVDTRDAIRDANVSISNNETTLIEIQDERE